jgi:hypothetical protein
MSTPNSAGGNAKISQPGFEAVSSTLVAEDIPEECAICRLVTAVLPGIEERSAAGNTREHQSVSTATRT